MSDDNKWSAEQFIRTSDAEEVIVLLQKGRDRPALVLSSKEVEAVIEALHKALDRLRPLPEPGDYTLLDATATSPVTVTAEGKLMLSTDDGLTVDLTDLWQQRPLWHLQPSEVEEMDETETRNLPEDGWYRLNSGPKGQRSSTVEVWGGRLYSGGETRRDITDQWAAFPDWQLHPLKREGMIEQSYTPDDIYANYQPDMHSAMTQPLELADQPEDKPGYVYLRPKRQPYTPSYTPKNWQPQHRQFYM